MTNFLAGDVSGAQVLTDNDHIYPQLWNELRQSRGATAVVGTTSECEYYCNGTDDQTEIQAALNAASAAGGGIVHVKVGNYSLSKYIWVPSYVTLEGEGWGTVFKLADGSYVSGEASPVIQPGGKIDENGDLKASADYTTTYGMVLRDFKVDANRAGQSGQIANQLYGIMAQWVSGARLENLYVINAHASGIGIWPSRLGATQIPADCIVTGCRTENNNSSTDSQDLDAGILASCCQQMSSRVIISDCISIGNRHGFCAEDIKSTVSFNNCIATKNWNHGISFHTAYGCAVNGGMYFLNEHDGIGYTGAGERWITINGAQCYRNERYGIRSGNSWIINGGSVRWNGDAGIFMSNNYNNVINGVSICGNGASDSPTYPYGIYTKGTNITTAHAITGNFFGKDTSSEQPGYGDSQTHDIFESGVVSNVVTGNSFNTYTGLQTPVQRADVSNSIIRNNKGWVTEKSGTGTITTAATSATITHGLDVTPTVDDISIIGAENPTNDVGTIWVDTLGATTFKVNVENVPGAGGFDFGWKAIVL